MRKIPSWMPQALGYCASAGSLIWLLHGYPIKQELLPALRELDWKWLFLSMVADVAAYVAQGWRWKTLLTPVIRVRFWRTVQSIFIGLFANEILPFRPGEVIRCYLLAHWNDLRVSLSFTSAVVERLIDGVLIVAAFLVTVGFMKGIPADLVVGMKLLAVLLLIGIILLAWVVMRKPEAHAALGESRWAATLRHIVEGLHLMGNLRTLGVATGISVVYLAVQAISLWALMKADVMDLSFWSAFGVLTIIRLGTVVPNAPGNLGVLNAACVTALQLFDVEKRDATTFSILLLGAWTLPIALAGAVAVALTGVNIGELRDRAKASARAQ